MLIDQIRSSWITTELGEHAHNDNGCRNGAKRWGTNAAPLPQASRCSSGETRQWRYSIISGQMRLGIPSPWGQETSLKEMLRRSCDSYEESPLSKW